MTEPITLTLVLQSDEAASPAEKEYLFERAVNLRRELVEGPVEDARLKEAAPEAYSMGFGLTPELWVTLAAAAIPSVIVFIQGWMLRQQDQHIRVKIGEIEVEIPRGAKPDEIDGIVKKIKQIERGGKK